MHSPIAATALLEPIFHSPIHPKAAARFPAAFRALFRFPTRTVRKPQEVVVLVTIEACLMVDTDDRQWGRHTRDHRNRENGEKSRRPYAPVSQAAAGTASEPLPVDARSGLLEHLADRLHDNFTDAELDAALREAVALAQEPA